MSFPSNLDHFYKSVLSGIVLSFSFFKYLICYSNSQQQSENVCVPVLRGDIEALRYVMCICVCVCVVGWTPSPLPSIYTNLPSCISLSLSLSVSVCLSFVFLFWVCPLHLFIWIPCACLCATHTDLRHSHNVMIQYSLCLSKGRGALENTSAHISVPFWSDCISSRSEGACLFSLTACELMSLFSQSALVVLRRCGVICHREAIGDSGATRI